jgi:hypothetical protein
MLTTQELLNKAFVTCAVPPSSLLQNLHERVLFIINITLNTTIFLRAIDVTTYFLAFSTIQNIGHPCVRGEHESRDDRLCKGQKALRALLDHARRRVGTVKKLQRPWCKPW